LEQFRIFSDVPPTEPWFGLMVGLFFLASLVATFWLLFRGPNHHRNRDRGAGYRDRGRADVS
jgi:hypothetical protein